MLSIDYRDQTSVNYLDHSQQPVHWELASNCRIWIGARVQRGTHTIDVMAVEGRQEFLIVSGHR